MPVSLIGAAIVMLAFGFSLNLLTMLAVVLSVGLVVDDAIVVVENIHRHQALHPDRPLAELIPGAVDEKILRKIVDGIERTLKEVGDDVNHPLRKRFDAALEKFIQDLHTSPEVMERAEQLKEEILSDDAVRNFSSSIWKDIKAGLVRRAERADETDVDMISSGLARLGSAILDDPQLLERVDGWLRNGVLGLVERYQSEVSQLIANTVRGWDPTATSQRIELAIGRDLQFIRINGTVVGGLVGLILYAITR